MTRVAVSIAAASVPELKAQAEAARVAGADLVELRVDTCAAQGCSAADAVAAVPQLARPAIVTVRHRSEGGAWEGEEDARHALLAEADRLGAEYVDLELAHHRSWKPQRAKLILSHHDFAGMGGDLPAVVARMRAAGAAVAKVAVTAKDAADLAPIEALYRDSDGPLVAIAMGEHGLASRLLIGAWGAEFGFARLDGQAGSAPGQPTVRDLLKLYRVREQRRSTRVFGVIGSPIAHSLSPLIHNAALAHHRLDAVYLPFRVEDAVAFWRACGSWIEGLSITIPHKHALLEEVDELEALAASMKAMNTIYRDDTGATVGANTDAGAIASCLEVAVASLRGRRVLVLGAGGVARTAAFACQARGAEVAVTNRTMARAVELAGEVGCRAVGWEEALAHPYEILINGTSVGMAAGKDKPQETPWPGDRHRRGSVVFDTVYTPLETRLLKDAAAADATTVCGLDMFIAQAIGQFERWTALRAPEHLMYRLALERLDPAAALTAQWRRKTTAG
jgi:3-dehydroquinate dehydratase/shikimate dehydrogenase